MKNDAWNIIVIIAIAAIVFSAAFYFSRLNSSGEREYSLQGIKVVSSSPPRNSLAESFQSHFLTVWISAANETEKIACRQVAASELVIGLASKGKNVTVQGRIADSYCIGESGKTACIPPAVIVSSSTANRLHILNNTVSVEGDEKWLCGNAPVIRDMFAWSLSK